LRKLGLKKLRYKLDMRNDAENSALKILVNADMIVVFGKTAARDLGVRRTSIYEEAEACQMRKMTALLPR